MGHYHNEKGFFCSSNVAVSSSFKKRDDEWCRYCESLVGNAEHTIFVCARWGAEREAVGRAVGAQLTPDTMVSLMLYSEQIWMLIESFASGPAPAVLRLGRTWLSASIGGGIFLFLPWLARLFGLPNGRVSADGSPGRTDDGRVARDFKLEPTAREV